ncbi:hypothetical protein HY639_01230 [Candidatus Woesearchaeota archaeon]|nr:hypothetical protein [Candidatus Woesearchaeota archaeon]
MGLREKILAFFGRRYESVEYLLQADGSFILRAQQEKKTVTYCSRERVAFASDLISLALQQRFYGDQLTPELYLPSLTIDIALEPFTTGWIETPYDEETQTFGEPEEVTWVVHDGLDYTKIFHDKQMNTTIGLQRNSKQPLSFLVAKVNGTIIHSLPFPDKGFAEGRLHHWEEIVQQEMAALDVAKYRKLLK